MRKYPCKKEVNEQVLESKMKEIFGKVAKNGKIFSPSSLDSLEVTAEVTGKKEISIETKSSVGKDQETVIKLYNKFLEDVTGYSSKERKKLMSKT